MGVSISRHYLRLANFAANILHRRNDGEEENIFTAPHLMSTVSLSFVVLLSKRFCQSVTIVIIILNVQQYNCRRTTCTKWIRFKQVDKMITIKINAQLMIYATQQSTIHFAAICQQYRSRRRRMSSYWMYHNTIALLGVVSRLFVFV